MECRIVDLGRRILGVNAFLRSARRMKARGLIGFVGVKPVVVVLAVDEVMTLSSIRVLREVEKTANAVRLLANVVAS